MKRWTTAMLGFVLAVTMPTFGQSVHLKGGANAEPNFVDQGLTLNSAASLAGLGNGDVLVTLSATAAASSTCTNQGGNGPQVRESSGGHRLGKPVDSRVGNQERQHLFQRDDRRARDSPIPGAPGWPNPNWRQDMAEFSFATATITVDQPAGNLVLTVTCTFSAPTTNGAVPRGDVGSASS